MTSDSDLDYFSRRAARERAVAASCSDKAVALTHLRMAEEYDRRAGMLNQVQVTMRVPAA